MKVKNFLPESSKASNPQPPQGVVAGVGVAVAVAVAVAVGVGVAVAVAVGVTVGLGVASPQQHATSVATLPERTSAPLPNSVTAANKDKKSVMAVLASA